MKFLGNAILEITKNDSKLVPYDLEIIEFDGERDSSYLEDLYLLETEDITLPEEFRDMKVDDTYKLTAEFWGEYSKDYWGEWDAEFEFREYTVEK